jgi:hypothetical protein
LRVWEVLIVFCKWQKCGEGGGGTLYIGSAFDS